ncbi:hypothetical protein BDB01DRAFT_841335 [Pilobolus umbonatus]|nr:hypothetical protein BDB01DRAFT_841335 [Pilobolus umbonatus]
MQPFNKYYPPDWTPDKGTVNKFVGKHPYGDRARKIDQGILIVRFELPFNIWCTGCDNHIGQVVSGAKKKMEEWDPEDTGVIALQDNATKEGLENDVMYRLEHDIVDKKKFDESIPRLTQLQHINDQQWADPYTRSQQLRKQLREEKKRDKVIHEENERIKDKHSLQIELLPETTKDVIDARSIEYHHGNDTLDKKKLSTAVSPLFKNESSSQHETVLSHIAKVHTRLKMDPFYQPNPFTPTAVKKLTQKRLVDVNVISVKKKKVDNDDSVHLVSYTDSDSD